MDIGRADHGSKNCMHFSYENYRTAHKGAPKKDAVPSDVNCLNQALEGELCNINTNYWYSERNLSYKIALCTSFGQNIYLKSNKNEPIPGLPKRTS